MSTAMHLVTVPDGMLQAVNSERDSYGHNVILTHEQVLIAGLAWLRDNQGELFSLISNWKREL